MCYRDREVGPYVGQLSNKMRRRMECFACKNEFSGAEGKTLHYILAHGECDVFQKDIEEEYGLRPPTASGLLKKMEANGLIIREPMPHDARLKKIVPTDKARQYEQEVMSNIRDLENTLMKGISEADLDVFFRVVSKMLDNIS